MPQPLKKTVIGFAGMSHLGLVSATAIAAKGFSVIAYDSNQSLITELSAGRLPVQEPQLESLLSNNESRQQFTDRVEDLSVCDVIYIADDVPTDTANISDLTPIKQWVEKIGPILNNRAVLVLLSQVPPGFTRTLPVSPEKLYYQVETLIFGQAVARALHPERFIIGCADPVMPLPPAYEMLLKAFDCPLLPMRYESAELAKLSINLLLVSSVTTSNVLAEISAMVGANWEEIVPTLQLDKRIGPHAYLKPGLGISGGNLERDLESIIQLGERLGADVGVVKAWCDHSRYQKEWVYRCLQENVFPDCDDPHIAILGLAYKANTDSTKNSPTLSLLNKLVDKKVSVHDPIVSFQSFSSVAVGKNIEETIRGADILIIMTPWQEYAEIDLMWLKKIMRGCWVIDPFHVLDHELMCEVGFHVLTLGKTVNLEEHQHA